jgi:hypothetical protein
LQDIAFNAILTLKAIEGFLEQKPFFRPNDRNSVVKQTRQLAIHYRVLIFYYFYFNFFCCCSHRGTRNKVVAIDPTLHVLAAHFVFAALVAAFAYFPTKQGRLLASYSTGKVNEK